MIAYKNGQTIIGRLGDGVIGEIADSKLKILSSEDKHGRQDNETWYPYVVLYHSALNPDHHEESWDNFEIIKRENDETDMYFILCDGLADVMIGDYNTAENGKRYEQGLPLLPPKLHFVYQKESFPERILFERNLSDYLEQNKGVKGSLFKNTGDDISIAVMRKKTVSFDKVVLREYDNDESYTLANDEVVEIGRLVVHEDGGEAVVVDTDTWLGGEQIVNQSDFFARGEVVNYLDDWQYDIVKRLCDGDEEKTEYIVTNLSLLKEQLKTMKTISFDAGIKSLAPYVEAEDMMQLIAYALQINLFSYDEETRRMSWREDKA